MKLTTIQRKRYRVRKKLKSVAKGRYRLCISRSSKNISAQIIDDTKNITLVSATSMNNDVKNLNINKSEQSTKVAEILAKKANEKNIKKVYFDRGIFKYHGRVKLFAETLRKNGMEF